MNIGSASGGIEAATRSALRGMASAGAGMDLAARQVASAGAGPQQGVAGPAEALAAALSPPEASGAAAAGLEALRGQEDRATGGDPLLSGIIGSMVAQRAYEANIAVLRRAEDMQRSALRMLG